MESPPHPKSEYELLRDKRVLEMKKALQPVLQAKKDVEEHFGKKIEGDQEIREKKGRVGGQRDLRRRGLRGRVGRGKRILRAHGGERRAPSSMNSEHDSSSEATRSDDEAIAAGAEEERSVFDSSDEEFEEEEPLVDRRKKRRQEAALLQKSPKKSTVELPATHRSVAPVGQYGPGWSWVPRSWMPQQHSQGTAPWLAPPAGPYPGAWPASDAATPEASESTLRRKKRTAYELDSLERGTQSTKPNFVRVGSGGEVEPSCEGKNAWDLAIRNFVPDMLDMSIIDWSKHSPQSLKKLRAALDDEFEYVGNPLSMAGFRLSVVRFMKSERCRLKVRYLKGAKTPPVHIHDAQWKRLIEYWKTDAQKLKSQKMVAARQSVKNVSGIGKKGKAGVEAQLREGRETSPGITDLADAMRGSLGQSRPVGDSTLWSDLSAWRQDVDNKFGQFMATSTRHADTIDELRDMFRSFMQNPKGEADASPSITQSALEMQELGDFQGGEVAGVLDNSRRKVVFLDSRLGKTGGVPRKKSLPVIAGAKKGDAKVTARTEHVNLSSDPDSPTATPRNFGPQWKVTGKESPEAKPVGVEVASDPVVDDVQHLVSECPSDDVEADAKVNVEGVVDREEDKHAPAAVEGASGSSEDNLEGEGGSDREQHGDSDHVEEAGAKERAPASETNPEKPLTPTAAHDAIPKTVDPKMACNPKPLVTVVAEPSQKKGKKSAKSPSKGRTQERETRSKTAMATEKKKDGRAKKVPKFSFGDEVILYNPRAVKQKVAVGTVNGVAGEHRFHFQDIPEGWWKVDVREVLEEGVALMYPNESVDQYKIEHAKGSAAMWVDKYMKHNT